MKTRSALFLYRCLFSQQEFCCFRYIQMMNFPWLKVHDLADDLQSCAHAKYGNDGADAHRAAQQPAHEQRHTNHDRLYHADGSIGETLAQSNQQRIPGAAALSGGHIEILPISHDEEAHNDHDAAEGQTTAFRQGKSAVDAVNIIAHQKGIQNGAVADFFLQ